MSLGDPTWQTASWTSVKFAELGEEHGYERGQNERGPYARKPYLVKWADVNTFAKDLRGLSSISGSSTSGNWIFKGPLLFPDDPSDGIYCTGIAVKPAGDIVIGTTPITYTYAIVTASFTPLTWDANQQTDDPFGFNSFGETPAEIASLATATQEMDFGFAEYPVPLSTMKFSDGVRPTVSTVLRLPLITMNVTWEKLPYIPMSQVRSLAGCVNNNTFLGAGTGTVFFDGATTSRQKMSDGTTVQRCRFTFRWRPKSWNLVLRPDGLTWDLPADTGGNKLYTLSDFTPLLLFTP